MYPNKFKVLICSENTGFGVRVSAALKETGVFAYVRKNDGKTILSAIKSDSPDVVILELTLPDTDAVSLIRQSRAAECAQPVFVVISDIKNTFIERQVLEAGASYCLARPLDEITLTELIIDMQKSSYIANRDDIEMIVTDVIQKLYIPAHIKGYYYLRTAIIDAICNKELISSVTKKLYPSVARKHSTTSSRVERAIRHAIGIAWDRGAMETICNFFGCNPAIGLARPTNSEFIALISDRIRLKLNRSQKPFSITDASESRMF